MQASEYFIGLAQYNRWANQRLYAVAEQLTDEQRQRDVHLYFGSLQATLRHLVLTDNAWMSLLRMMSIVPLEPQATDTFAALCETRRTLDAQLEAIITDWSEADFDVVIAYTPWGGDFKGMPYSQPRRNTLAHLFNHHAHHRGQAHTGLTLLGLAAPPLDLFVKQLGVEA